MIQNKKSHKRQKGTFYNDESVKVYKYITILNIDNEQQNKWRLVELKEVDRTSWILQFAIIPWCRKWQTESNQEGDTTQQLDQEMFK